MTSGSQCPMEMPERRSLQGETELLEAWEPMSDKINGLGQCEGAEVKNFVKAVMETWSCEYGFIF